MKLSVHPVAFAFHLERNPSFIIYPSLSSSATTTTTTTRRHQQHCRQKTRTRNHNYSAQQQQPVYCPNLASSRIFQNLQDDDQPIPFSTTQSINEDALLLTTLQEEIPVECHPPTVAVVVSNNKTKAVPQLSNCNTNNNETQALEETLRTNATTSSMNDTVTSVQSIFLLNLVAVIWGTQHSVIKIVVDDCDPASFSFARFALACAIASPFLPSFSSLLKLLQQQYSIADIDDKDDGATTDEDVLSWRWGLEMGTWMFLGYAFQAIGLEYTTAQRSGFLLYLNVKFVPFFARILFGKKISLSTWGSAFAALVGTALLSYDGTSMVLNLGDLWSVAAAAASAMFILRLESATTAVKDSAKLNATSLWMVTVTSFVWCILTGITRDGQVQVDQSISSNYDMWNVLETASMTFPSIVSNVANTIVSHPVELIYLGGVTTALSNYIQTKAQKGISAERASIIYALDPVYGAFFASVLLGEGLGQYGFAGAGLITVAAATNAFLDLGPQKTEQLSSNRTTKNNE